MAGRASGSARRGSAVESGRIVDLAIFRLLGLGRRGRRWRGLGPGRGVAHVGIMTGYKTRERGQKRRDGIMRGAVQS